MGVSGSDRLLQDFLTLSRSFGCVVPVVLLRGVDKGAASLLRFLSWLRQWGSGWAWRVLKDMEPMGWQDTVWSPDRLMALRLRAR